MSCDDENKSGCRSIGRRKLLVLSGVAAAATACRADIGSGYGPDQSDGSTDDAPPVDSCAPGSVMLGPVTNFAMGTWTRLASPRVIVAQDAAGLYAYSTVCTHAACIVDAPTATGSATCACHGSIFGPNGELMVGPAAMPLPHYLVTVCGGVAFVDVTMSVAPTTRTPAV